MLERYFDILEGRRKPVFHRTREEPSGMSREDALHAGLDELWAAHDAALARIRRGDGKESGPDETNLLELKVIIARRLLSSCCFCERRCGADRAGGKTGFCGVPADSRYASEFFHFGEERELVPSHTIFFSGCNFRCVYCQNWDIATRPLSGFEADPRRLARIIDRGRLAGSRNVNFVGGNPDPHLHTCLATISLLETDVPVVWNSNAYASSESMKLLDGVVDIFLSDFRYGNDACAQKYSDVPRYWDVVTRNFRLACDRAEVMLRHLVLPGHLECCTRQIMDWVSRNIPEVYFNLMFQYHPEHRAREFPELNRLLTPAEMLRARELAREFGIEPSG